MNETVAYKLIWESGARPPVHPKPMIGERTFYGGIEAAIKFFDMQASDARFISLTKVVTIQKDVSDLFVSKKRGNNG